MKKPVGAIILALGVLVTGAPNLVSAQTFPLFEQRSAIAVVDQDALFTGSNFGQAILAEIESAGTDLAAENRTVEQQLEAEELELTEKRKILPVEEFNALALEFDTKVKQIREQQATKQRDLNVRLTSERAKFFEQITPILLDYIDEIGVELLLNKDTVALASRGSDITQAAIQRINELLKD